MNEKTFHQSLPKKRMSAGALFFDENGRLLLVDPTYKPGWEIPGGVVEEGESPWEACRREVREELGLERPLRRLLCIDYIRARPSRTEGIAFLFGGGILTPAEIGRIRLPANELSRFHFCPLEQLAQYARPRLLRRVRHCLAHPDETLYLEDQKPIGARG